MKKREFKSSGKRLVIGGYFLLVFIMLLGLFSIYRNLVVFSESKIRAEDRQELLVVSNIINQLYEAEAATDLLTFESASNYVESFDSIRPIISLRIDTLKQLASDIERVSQLDSIEVLLDRKMDNLIEVVELMDSLRNSPSIIRETNSSYLPKKSSVSEYLNDGNGESNRESNVDTTIVKRNKRGFFKRIGDAITGKQDSTVIVEKVQSTVVEKDYKVVVDTIVNMVRESERLNLESQRKFQVALARRQSDMSATNQILTVGVDNLLKQIEQEEREKVLTLVAAKETIISKSYSTVFWVSIIAVTIAIVFGILFIIDINRSKRYKQKLEQSNEKINKLLLSREKLMLSISHDIKAPMSSVLGYIELIECKSNSENEPTYLSNMKQSSEHVLQLVSNLLDFQRIESHTWRENNINIYLKALTESTADSFKPLAQKKNLSYSVVNNIPNHLMAFGDPFIIREIYTNVISNAIKYTLKGEVVVTLDVDTQNNMLKLKVKDTGIGIADEDRHLIFEEFERIGVESIDEYAEGTGLGMAITKGLVDQLGGDISFESEKGVGTEFVVDLPIKIIDEIEPNDTSSALMSESKRFEGVSILLVDDDPIQQIMASEMLKTQGVNVLSETNPTHVIDILKKDVFDIIFLDIQMPEINGFTLIKQIKDSGVIKNDSTPIIAVTAASEIKIQEYEDLGFSNFLNKPFTSSDLFDMISSYIGEGDNKKEMGSLSSGVEALISYVKDDKESSLAILNAFMDESKLLCNHLKSIDENYDKTATSNIAHKMLPLYKMMGDEEASSALMMLEKKAELSEEKLSKIISKVDYYIKQADILAKKV